MGNYTLSNSAAVIDSAITRVASADTTPTANSQSMVTSGGVKAALDANIVTSSSSTTTAISAAHQFSLKAGYTQLHSGTYGQNTSLTGTAPSSGFLMVESSGASVTVGGISFYNQSCIPLAKDEVYTITPGTNSTPYVYDYRFRAYFKSFQTP